MDHITAPGPTARQVSMTIAGGRFALCVLAKRTYVVDDDGHSAPAAIQTPLQQDIVLDEDDPDLIAHDTDLVPFKPRTDLILKGHAYSGGAAGVRAAISVGAWRKEILVVGDRRAAARASGGVVISAAEPFEKMPVGFARAYGGRDHVAEALYGNPWEVLRPYLAGTDVNVDLQSPFLYPRNPCGTGFLVKATPRAIEACRLPNLEDPSDPLTPERIAMGPPLRWIQMPLPQGLSWVSPGWFPRLAFAGLAPGFDEADRPIPEVVKGLLPASLIRLLKDPAGARPSIEERYRAANGAPLDQQLPYLSADETIELAHLHPRKRRWRVRLPGEKPALFADGRDGKLLRTNPVLHTVVVEPDQGRISVVWRGAAPALRPYSEEELSQMPLRVEW